MSVYIYIYMIIFICMYIYIYIIDIYIYRYVMFIDCVDFPPMSSTMAGSDTDFFSGFVREDDPHFRAGLAMNLRYLLPPGND